MSNFCEKFSNDCRQYHTRKVGQKSSSEVSHHANGHTNDRTNEPYELTQKMDH